MKEVTGILVAAALLVGGSWIGHACSGVPHDADTPTMDLPAARAYQPQTYADGSVNPDYKDMAVLALQHALDSVTDELEAARAHDADIHRGTMVPLDYRCPDVEKRTGPPVGSNVWGADGKCWLVLFDGWQEQKAYWCEKYPYTDGPE